MRVIQTSFHVPLSAVKPLEGLMRYRAFCLEAAARALLGSVRLRNHSLVDGGPVKPFGTVDGFAYVRCVRTGSLFLSRVSDDWGRLLAEVSAYRHTQAFSPDLVRARDESVYLPKLQWIESTLRMLALPRSRVLEVMTPPSEFTRLIRASDAFVDVVVTSEAELIRGDTPILHTGQRVEVAVLLESLDRADDPEELLRRVTARLAPGGVLFITALVSSGFDLTALGIRNLYLYPPDRTNCFSMTGLLALLDRSGVEVVEASTPGILDVEIVQAHLRHDSLISLSPFEAAIVGADENTRIAFQMFLQEHQMSSFARIVGRTRGG